MKSSRPIWWWLARLVLAAVFIGASLAKIRDPEGFALAVHRYRLLPGVAINPVAILLPWVELVAGLALLWPGARPRRAAAFLIAAMLAVFTGAIILNLTRGIESSCGCFSTRADDAVSDGWNLLRNLALLWLAGAAFFEARRPRTSTGSPPTS